MPDFFDTMVLGAGHSMLASHVPGKNVKPEMVSQKFYQASKMSKESIDSFGLFGSSIDYNTFYPDAKPDMFNPKEDEFIEPMFRMLSSCIVAKNYNPTEFPKKVLKESMHLLVGQTVNCDHETDVANAIGTVKSVSWQEAYTENGVEIPAGINAVLKIDGISNPRIVRGIYMDPPSIHSNSVTVMFEWKPSHKFVKEWEFYDKLGTIAEDGTMVRRIATRIIAYKETSLVSHGADPFAQLIKNGKINNPQYAGAVYYSFSDQEPMELDKLKTKLSFFDFKGCKEVDIMYNTSKPNYVGGKNPNENLSHQNNLQMTLQEFLEQLFGENMMSLEEGAKPSTEIALSQIKSVLAENKSLSEAKAQAESKLADLQNEINSLQEKIKVNEAMAKIGTTHLSEVRESAIASYKKLVGEEKIDQNIITLLNAESTSLETLISLKASYDASLEEKFPMQCAECGSHNVSRASSMVNKDEPKNKVESVSDSISAIIQNKLNK